LQIFAPFMVKRNRGLHLMTVVLVALCLVGILAPTVLAQNTYVITDGQQVTVHNSFASDPEVVLDEVGVELDSDDFYTTEADDGVSHIQVQRSQTITVNYCGQRMEAETYGTSVDAFLDTLGIRPYGNYSISHPLDSQTFDGMHIEISNIMETTEVYTAELPCETTFTSDNTLPLGQEKVLVEGESGQVLQTANVVYIDGKEESRTVTEETVLEAPVKRIVAVGTAQTAEQSEDSVYIGDGYIVLPTGEVLTYTHTDRFYATAYTHNDEGCNMITATGTTVHWGTVAVDPDLIPYGTRMFVVSEDGYVYGLSTAEDCGGAIQGHRLDLYMPTHMKAYYFGRRWCTVYFLGESDW